MELIKAEFLTCLLRTVFSMKQQIARIHDLFHDKELLGRKFSQFVGHQQKILINDLARKQVIHRDAQSLRNFQKIFRAHGAFA